MEKINLKNPLAFFDLETTGTNIIKDRIIEISIVRINLNYEKTAFTKRINPQIPIPAEVTKIHGIKDKDIQNAPKFKLVAKEIVKFLEGCDLAGFNILQFDIPLLTEEFLRVGIDFKTDNRKIVDVQKIFHLMEKRTLSAAYKFYCGKDLKNAHSSMADTLATLEVLESQINRYNGQDVKDLAGNTFTKIENDVNSLHNLSTTNMIDYAKRMVYDKKGTPIFNFGKHKGKPVSIILKEEPSYYDWIINSEFPQDTKRKLTKIRLEMINS